MERHSISHRLPNKAAPVNVALAKGRKLSAKARQFVSGERVKARAAKRRQGAK